MTGTRCPCHACQLPSKQTGPYTTSHAQHYETPGVFTPPSAATHLGWPSQTQLLGQRRGGRGRGLGMAPMPGATCSLRSLGWARGERRWQRLAEAQPDVLHQAWDAAGAAYLPRSRRFSLLPYLAIAALLACSSGLFSPGLQTARGGCAPTPGSIPQERGMGQSIQPFPGRVEIILTEPFPSSLGISRQVCDSPGHLGKAWAILQPQGSNRSLPLHPRHDFLGKLGWDLGGARMLTALPHPLAC